MTQYQKSFITTKAEHDILMRTVLLPSIEVNNIYAGTKHVGDGATPGGIIFDPHNISGVPLLSDFPGSGTDRSRLADALEEAPSGGLLMVDTDLNLGTTQVANPSGAGFTGAKALYYTQSNCHRVQNMLNREPWRLDFGQEYLHVFITKLFQGQAIKVVMFGDSNSQGYAGAALALKMNDLFNVQFINRSVSGSTIRNFIDNGGLAAALADNADLYINAYGGTNEPYFGRTIATYATDYDYVMSQLRNAGGKGSRAILCRTSVPMNDAAMGGVGPGLGNGFDQRDELYNFQCREVIRLNAIKYEAAFFDVNGRWPDAFVDFVGTMKDTWLDPGNRVHTQPAFTEMVAQALFDFIVPSAITGGRVVTGSADKDANTPPSQFPKGVSIYRCQNSVLGGFIVTFKEQATSFPMQLNWEFGNGLPKFAMRVAKADGTGWGGWGQFGANAYAEAPIVPGPGLALPAPATGGGSTLGEQMRGRVQSGFGRGSGFLIVQSPGILTAGVNVGNIGSAYGPSPTPIYKDKIFYVWDGIGLGAEHFERLDGSWDLSGNLTLLQTSTISAARIYLDCGFVRND